MSFCGIFHMHMTVLPISVRRVMSHLLANCLFAILVYSLYIQVIRWAALVM